MRKWNNIYKLAHTVRWQIKILPLGLQMLVNRMKISFWCYFFFLLLMLYFVFRMLEWLRFYIMLYRSLCFSFVTYIHEVCKNDSFMKAIFILVLTMFLVSLKKKFADLFQCFELINQHFWKSYKRVEIFGFYKATLQIHIES